MGEGENVGESYCIDISDERETEEKKLCTEGFESKTTGETVAARKKGKRRSGLSVQEEEEG